MDSFEFNKLAGAVLGAALGFQALSIASEMIYGPREAKTPGYEVAAVQSPVRATAAATLPNAPATGAATQPPIAATAVAPGGASGAATADGGAVAPIAVRLATADPANGADLSKKCMACHTLLKDQPAKVGPNLWGVLGGPTAHMAAFKYSDAMVQDHADGVTWTYENLDKFLTMPKGFIPGTAMGFAGLPDPKDRADLIAYLRTLSDNPVPLPTVADAALPGSNPNAPPKSAPLPPPAPAK